VSAGRFLAAGLVLLAVVTAAPLWALGGLRLAGLLADDAPAYAAAIWWVCLAPAPLALALLGTVRTPWPWVGTAAVHLVVLVAVTTRLRHLVPGSVWVGVAVSVVVGVASAVAVVTPAGRRAGPG
jgi:hypothetical protein